MSHSHFNSTRAHLAESRHPLWNKIGPILRNNTKWWIPNKNNREWNVIVTYNLGKMLPACCTSSYRSIMEQPRRVSSLKNISSFLNSSNALMSSESNKHIMLVNWRSSAKYDNKLCGSSRRKKKSETVNRQRQLTKLVVFVRGKAWSTKLGEHLGGVLEGVPQIVRVLTWIDPN